jgi:hypothetical protein
MKKKREDFAHLALEMLVSIIAWMDGDRRIPQHRLHPRCRHDHLLI